MKKRIWQENVDTIGYFKPSEMLAFDIQNQMNEQKFMCKKTDIESLVLFNLNHT